MNFDNDALIEGITKIANFKIHQKYPLIEKFVNEEQVKAILDSWNELDKALRQWYNKNKEGNNNYEKTHRRRTASKTENNS